MMKAGALVALFIVSPAFAAAPAGPSAQEKADALRKMSVEDLSSLLEAGADKPGVIHQLRRRHDKKAIPVLKKAFEKATHITSRRSAAAALVAVGEADEKYWRFIADPAKEAVERDAPSMLSPNGKSRNPEFAAWCQAHGVEQKKAEELVWQEDPQRVLALSMTEDKRAIPLLMTGLKSKNPLVAAPSARGLARIQYGPAIKEIIAVAERGNTSVANYLLFFHTPEADAAAKRLIAKASYEFLEKLTPDKREQVVFGE